MRPTQQFMNICFIHVRLNRELLIFTNIKNTDGPSKTHGERCEVTTWEISDDVLLNGEYGDTCHIE